MIEVVHRSHLPVPPERVWRFFAQEIDDRYADWHREHLRWRWLSGRPLEPGSVWFAEEWVGRMRVSSRCRVHEAEPERGFSYRLAYPSALVRAGGWFRFLPAAGGGCDFSQGVHMGFSTPVAGRALDLLIGAIVPVADLRRHVREEHANLPALLT